MALAHKTALKLGMASFAAVAMAAVAGLVAPGQASAATAVSVSPSVSASSSKVSADVDYAVLFNNKETTTFTHTTETTYAVRQSARYAAETDAFNSYPVGYGGGYGSGYKGGGHDYKPSHDKGKHKAKPVHHDKKQDYKPQKHDDKVKKTASHKPKSKNSIEWHDLRAVGCDWYGGKYHASRGGYVGFVPKDHRSHPKGTRYTVIMKWSDQDKNSVYKPNMSWNQLNDYRHKLDRKGSAWMQVNAYTPDGNVKYYRTNLSVH